MSFLSASTIRARQNSEETSKEPSLPNLPLTAQAIIKLTERYFLLFRQIPEGCCWILRSSQHVVFLRNLDNRSFEEVNSAVTKIKELRCVEAMCLFLENLKRGMNLSFSMEGALAKKSPSLSPTFPRLIPNSFTLNKQ